MGGSHREMAEGSSGRLGELDALRGIAAMVVVLFHYTSRAPLVLPGIVTVPVHLEWGKYGVELFFAISGFVIFMTLERTRTTADFVVSRFARLFPSYWIAIVVTTVALAGLGARELMLTPMATAANFTMLEGFLYLPAVDGVYWSLTVELGFYVCMLSLWRLDMMDRIETVLLGWIGLQMLWWLVPALPSRLAMIMALEYIPFFTIGICAYRVWNGTRQWRDQALPLLAALGATTLAHGASGAAAWLLVAAIFLALVAQRLSWLTARPLLWLGGISYPLYLVHQNAGYAVMASLQRHGVGAWASLAIAIVAALGMAHAIRERVEQPALARIRSAWKARGARPSAAG